MKKLFLLPLIFLSLFANGQKSLFDGLFSPPSLINVGKGYQNIIDSIFTYLPQIIVPDTIPVTTTANITLYGDDIVNWDIGDTRITVDYTCSVGTESGNNFVINALTAGTYPLTIKAKFNNEYFDSANIQLKVFVPPTIPDTLTFLPLGNSLRYLGRNYYVAGLRTAIGKVKMVGTEGVAPNKHEGHPGWTYNSFVNTGSPMFIGGALNFNAYRKDSLGLSDPLDILSIELGINDIISNDIDLYDEYAQINRDIVKLVDAAIADTVGNIFIVLPPICENSGAGWLDDYGTSRDQNYYIYKMKKFHEMLLTQFDNKKYHSTVKVAYTGLFINRDTHYLKTDGVHTSGVHLTNPGYSMMAISEYVSLIGRIVQ